MENDTEDQSDWMWSRACSLLVQAESRATASFRPVRGGAWQPPVDVVEVDGTLVVVVALPGVDPDTIEAVIETDMLRVSGIRRLPQQWGRADRIYRLELPFGRFERHVRLPAMALRRASVRCMEGCLVVTLEREDIAR